MNTSQTRIKEDASNDAAQHENMMTSSNVVAEADTGAPPSQGNAQREKFKMYILVATPLVLATVVFSSIYASGILQSSEAAASHTLDNMDLLIQAALMISKMNLSADPCVDFNEYACGRFNKETALPIANPTSLLTDENLLVLKAIVEEPSKRGEPAYLTNMKRLYQSCIDEARIEALGVTAFLNEKTFINAWPTLNPYWSVTTFNLNDLIERHEKVFVEPIFSYGIDADMVDSNKKSLKISEPKLGLPPLYFLQTRDFPPLMAYQKTLADTAVLLGAARNIAGQDSKDVVDLEIELAKIMVPDSERRDKSKQYNPVKLSDLTRMYPQIDIPRAIRAAFSTARVSLADDQIVINEFPTYMGNLSAVILKAPKRSVQNLFGFRYAQERVAGLTRGLRDIAKEFQKVITGSAPSSPRWSDCLQGVSTTFWKGLAKQYIARNFTDSSKAEALELVDNIQEEFKQMLTDNPWMSQTTKDEALKKLAVMRRKIGYPEEGFEDADIERMYEDYVMQTDNFYANRLLAKSLSNIEGLQNFQTPVDKEEWYMHPYEVNAQYIPVTNEINIPAGILRPPFFSERFQDSMNYGGIGGTIGHEITHGFDDQGSQYDSMGNVRDWWATNERTTFVQKTSCFVNQFNNFYVPEINKNVSGINTQGESVADSDGLRISFRAYKKLPETGGKPASMPGLDLTPDQLFFLTFSQTWCSKTTPEVLMFMVTSDPHPPEKFRIIGTLQNSQDFATAYNCPRGSMMNPVKKCSVW